MSIVKVLYLPNYNKEWGPVRYNHIGDSGFDLRAALENDVILRPSERKLIVTGIKVCLPENTELQVRSRSGMALKMGVIVANQPGTVDQSYTGEIGVILYNISNYEYLVKPGDKIAQAVIAPVLYVNFEEINEINETTRGSSGFGSTGTV